MKPNKESKTLLIKQIILTILICLFIFLLPHKSYTQIVSGNGFLKDTFVEVAIGSCGNFASNISAPAGYHPRGSGNSSSSSWLGFVANPAKNNWANYVGDYFLPGTPEEGFGLTINGVNYNNNLICETNDISGSVIDYQSSSFEKSATWQGSINGLTITAKTFIPSGAVYFITRVTLTNTTGSPIQNIYYMRNVDPDQGRNTPGSSGVYTTYNSIVNQNPNACARALVSAATSSAGADYLGLGSIDSRARVTYGGFSNRSAINIWNGTGFTTSGTNHYYDEAISIAFSIGTLNPNESTTFSYAYILNQNDLEQALAATNVNLSIDSVSANVGNLNNICSGSSVPITLTNTGTYTTWAWSPSTGLNTTTGTSVIAKVTDSIVYTATGSGPCGTVQLTIPIVPVLQPAPGNAGPISGPITLAAGQKNVVYSIDSVPNATFYDWVIPPGATINSASNQRSITISVSNNAWCGDITVTPRNTCGKGISSGLPVCINSPYGITLSAISPICEGKADTAYLYYSNVIGSPPYYSINWSDSAKVAGFTSVFNVPLPSSPIKILLPSHLPAGSYSGTFTVGNGVYNSIGYPMLITIKPLLTPSISIKASTDSICAGSPVTFTATVINAGTAPIYQWLVNNKAAGTNDSVFTSNTIKNGDTVTCVITSNEACLTASKDTSNPIKITVTALVTPSVTLSSDFDVIEVGDTVILTAKGTNGGTAPLFSFRVDGVVVQNSSSNVYKTSTLAVGERSITCILTSSIACTTQKTDTSNTILVIINKLSQDITFNAIPEQTYGDPPFTLQATATSGLPASYSIVSGPATISGSQLTMTGVGTVTVKAYQAGNGTYNPSIADTQSFCVKAGLPSAITGITETCPGTQYSYSIIAVSGATYTWAATGGASVIPSSNTAKITFPVAGVYTVSVKYKGNCDTAGPAQVLTVQAYDTPLTGSITKMLPADGSTGLFFPITFSWSPIENALYYDLYIWPASGSRPATPFKEKITQISYTVTGGLIYDTLYKWQIIAKKACYGIESNIQTFKLRSLPDLIVQNISVPSTATSESQISINWTIKNQGKGTTDKTWTDAVYISDNSIFDNNAKQLGQAYNVSALSQNQSYTTIKPFTYTIPVGTQGVKYFFVKTNASNSLTESDVTNNTKVSDSIKITLAPPPDLQVTALSLTPSSNIIAGNNLKVNYTVANRGTGPTSASSWYDYIYLSDSSILNTAKDKLLATRTHNGKLLNSASYKDSATGQIPANTYGKYYVHVVTDANKAVFEYLQENNNTATSDPLTVFLNPTPNLTVNNVVIQTDTVTNRQPFTVEWTEKNAGTASAKPGWSDNVYLSADTVFNSSLDINIGTLARTTELVQQNSYNASLTTSIPAGIRAGKYYVFIVADAYNSVYESDAFVANAEEDNTARSTMQVTIANPDLKAISITNHDTAFSEDTVAVSWQVSNISSAGIYNGYWNDVLYLSDDTVLSAGDILLNTVPLSNVFVAGNSSYTKNQNVIIPRGISGKKYLILSSDNSNNILENNENNNAVYKTIYIKLSPYPDLTVTKVTAASSDTVGKPVSITYTVKNKGTKALTGKTWRDFVYLTTDNNVNTTQLIYLGSVTQNQTVNVNGTYNQSISFTLPSYLATGYYYPLVFTDANNDVYEYTAENNNKAIGDSLKVLPLPYIDLAVDSAYTTNSAIKAGDNIPVTWTVVNKGPVTTPLSSWHDAVYLSSDTVVSSSDKTLLSASIAKTLKPGDAYTVTQVVSIPQDVSGPQYLLVAADYENEARDTNRLNNTRILTINPKGGSHGTIGDTIVITQPVPSDLIVDTLQIPTEGTASQPITISYTIKNAGAGITQSRSWRDKIYLSTDFVVSPDDVLLGNFTHTDSLAAGASYTNTQQVFLPKGISGNYIVLFQTDAENSVYEKNGEDNNDTYASLFVKAQLPCDLVPDSVLTVLSTIIAGEPASFQWKLLNEGDNPATGYIREAVYLSKDSVWDNTDALLGYIDGDVNILPKTGIARQITARPNVAPGQYYPIVRTDILDNLDEVNEDNNNGSSASPVTVDVRQLLLNVTAADTLQTGVPIYYRFVSPDSLTGKTLSVSLTGDSVNGAVNRLFISHDTLPDENHYQFSAQTPFKANQQALVPSLVPGNYYITATGISSQALPKQPVTLLATIIPFSILSVEANTGGNTGFVTVKLSGARFEPNMTVKLSGSTEITAQHITFISSVTAFATFDLTGQPLGIYTVKAINSLNDTARLTNGFEIVQGSAGGTGLGGNGFTCSIQNIGYENNFAVTSQNLPTARSNTTAVITILFQNTGNVDIPIQHVVFTSPDSVYINFQPDYTGKMTELLLECKEDGGPDDVLRPGATGYIKIYALIKGGPHEIINFTIEQ